MKKTILIFAALMLTVCAQCSCKPPHSAASDGMYSPADVERNWKKRVIKVPGQKNDIVALFEAFYMVWPTEEGNRIAHTTNPKLFPEGDLYEEGSTIDRKNGFVESIWYEGEELGTISACVWRRKNGHKLFAVNMHVDGTFEKDFLCFYDFDPAKRTLTPEDSPIKPEHLNYPDKRPLWYTLPQEGKTLEVLAQLRGSAWPHPSGKCVVFYIDLPINRFTDCA